jgi:hypothetical protein
VLQQPDDEAGRQTGHDHQQIEREDGTHQSSTWQS